MSSSAIDSITNEPQRSAGVMKTEGVFQKALPGVCLGLPVGGTLNGKLVWDCEAVEEGQSDFHKTIAATSTAPSAAQQTALPRSPANQYPVAALKQRIALVHPLAQAAGLLSIFRSSIERF